MHEIDYVYKKTQKQDSFLNSWEMGNKKDFEDTIGWMRKFTDDTYNELKQNKKYKIAIVGSSNGVERKNANNNKISYSDIFIDNLNQEFN